MIERQCLCCGKTFLTHECYVRRGKGKYCSISCGTRHRNLNDNPAKRADVRAKISANHADVRGEMNPMYGVRGESSPGFIDGRYSLSKRAYRGIMLLHTDSPSCKYCGKADGLHVHHKDGNRCNNSLDNLEWVCARCHNTKAHRYLRDEHGRFVGSEIPT